MSCLHLFVKELRPMRHELPFADGEAVEITPLTQLGGVALLAGTNRFRRLHWCIDCGALVSDKMGAAIFTPERSR